MADIRLTGFPVVLYHAGGQPPNAANMTYYINLMYGKHLRLILVEATTSHSRTVLQMFPDSAFVNFIESQYPNPSIESYSEFTQALFVSHYEEFKKPVGSDVLVFKTILITLQADKNGKLPDKNFLDVFQATVGPYIIINEIEEPEDENKVVVTGELTPWGVHQFVQRHIKNWEEACAYLRDRMYNFQTDEMIKTILGGEPLSDYQGKIHVMVMDSS